MSQNYPKWPKNDAWIYALFLQIFFTEKAVPQTFSLLECMMAPSMEPSMAADLMFFVKVPATQKLILGDWIAQWDTTYGAWFFYNINTGRRLSRFRQNILRGFANTLPWHNVQNVSHQTMHLVSLMIHLRGTMVLWSH